MNVILLMNDSWRPDFVGAYGNDWIHTPVLDQFARESAVFERSYVGSFATVPCRHDLIKGRFGSPLHGWYPLEWAAMTLPKALRENGYVTMLIHDTPHLMNYGYGFDRPFHAWEMIRGNEVDRWRTDHFERMELPHRERFNSDAHMALYHRSTADRRSEADYQAPKVMQAVCDWLERNARHEKFFLWVDSFDPHEPWDPPQHYIDLYDTDYAGPDFYWPRYSDSSLYTEAEIARMRARYAAEITMVDRWIGRVLDTVDRVGLRNNTVIVLMSDHGHYFGEHGQVRKWGPRLELYEESARQVMMVRHPDLTSGKRVSGLVQPADFTPTVFEMLGITPPAEMDIQGTSWLPLISGERRTIHRAAVSGGYPRRVPVDGNPGMATTGSDWSTLTVTSGNWSLIDHPDPAGRELYRLDTDPGQEKNLIAKEGETASRLHGYLLEFLREHGAPEWMMQVYRDGPDSARQPDATAWQTAVRRRGHPYANTPPGLIV